ncbi:MAG: hypothetical protein HFG01_12730 [Oscillibacter sp.]|nr:hypothetical protein [Oscillibacter sp.]
MKETRQGRLSCAINQFSELLTGSENLLRLLKTPFSTAWEATASFQ